LARPFDASSHRQVEEDDGGEDEEAALLSLHRWVLLFSSANAETAPYAFISLRHAVLKEVDPITRRLVFASRHENSWPPVAASDDEWLELCLLLGDGRFQSLEAPQLELRLVAGTDFDTWATRLGEVCYDDGTLRGLSGKTTDLKLPALLSTNWPDEPLQVPPVDDESL